MIIGLISSACASFLILLMSDLNGAIICMVILGATMSAAFLSIMLMFCDIVDEASLNAKKRKEGIYAGVFTFFDRLGYVFQTIIFTVVHILTRFDPENPVITPAAKAGILASFTWIPAIGLFIAALIAWKTYNLTPDKMITIKNDLKELGL